MHRFAGGILAVMAENFYTAWRSGVGKVLLHLEGWSCALGDTRCQRSECREALLQMEEQDLGSCEWVGVVVELNGA